MSFGDDFGPILALILEPFGLKKVIKTRDWKKRVLGGAKEGTRRFSGGFKGGRGGALGLGVA